MSATLLVYLSSCLPASFPATRGRLSPCWPIFKHFCLSVYSATCPSSMLVCLSTCLPVCLPPTFLPPCSSVCLYVYMSVCLSKCLYACLFLHGTCLPRYLIFFLRSTLLFTWYLSLSILVCRFIRYPVCLPAFCPPTCSCLSFSESLILTSNILL